MSAAKSKTHTFHHVRNSKNCAILTRDPNAKLFGNNALMLPIEDWESLGEPAKIQVTVKAG